MPAMPKLQENENRGNAGAGAGARSTGVSTVSASAAPNAPKGNANSIPSSSSSASYLAPQSQQQQQQYSVLICGNQVEAQRFIREVTNSQFAPQAATAASSGSASGADRSLCITCEGSSVRVATQDLRRLTLSNVRLTQVDHFLGRVAMLTHVNLSFNRLHDVSTLTLLPQLQVLDISHNKIVSLDALRASLALRTLRCHDNSVESLEPLLEMKSLRELWVSNNSIEWQEFVYVMPLLSLHTLVKYGNPADDKEKVDLFIQALRPTLEILDGVSLVQETAKDRFDKDEGIASIALQREGVAFLRSTDGRVMLAQAQANLPRHQRERLQASEGSILRLEYQATGRHTTSTSTSTSTSATNNNGNANFDAVGGVGSHPPPPSGAAGAGAAGGETVYHRGRKLRPAAAAGAAGERRSRSHSQSHSHSHSRSPSDRNRNRNRGAAAVSHDSDNDYDYDYGSESGHANDDDSRDDHVQSSGYGQKKKEKKKTKPKATAAGPFPPESGVQMFQAKRRGGGGGAAAVANADSSIIGRAGDANANAGQPSGYVNGNGNGGNNARSNKYNAGNVAESPETRHANMAAGGGDSGSESESGSRASLSLSPLPKHKKHHNSSSSSNAIGQGVSGSSANNPPVQLLRFGDNGAVVDLVHNTEEATVALCLYANNDGYARWQKGAGPVAISFEGGKLFGSYKNGSLAVILDKDGNGSVMDAQGHNVLLLTSGTKAGDGVATAKVLEPKSGRPTAEYRQGESTQQAQPQAPAAAPGKAAAAAAAAASVADKHKHSWKLNGLLVDFLPRSWELLVRFSNERMVCEFSSAHGGRLLKEKGSSSSSSSSNEGTGGAAGAGAGGASNLSALSESGSGGGEGGGGGGGAGGRKETGYSAAHARAHPSAQRTHVQSNARLSTEEHEAVRKDVGDILSNLDSLLKGLELKGGGGGKGDGKGKGEGKGSKDGTGAGAGAGVKGKGAAREKR